MPKKTFDAYEEKATREGGALAGEWLDEIGTTDLAALDVTQYREFCKRIIRGYETALRRMILNNEAPF